MLPWHFMMDAPPNVDRCEQPPLDVTAQKIDLASVVGPSPAALNDFYAIFTEAVEASWKRRAFESDRAIFPYDTTPMLIQPSVLKEFEKTVELTKSRPHIAHRLITPQVSITCLTRRAVHLDFSTCVDSSASERVCDTIYAHCITVATTRPLGGILRSLRS